MFKHFCHSFLEPIISGKPLFLSLSILSSRLRSSIPSSFISTSFCDFPQASQPERTSEGSFVYTGPPEPTATCSYSCAKRMADEISESSPFRRKGSSWFFR